VNNLLQIILLIWSCWFNICPRLCCWIVDSTYIYVYIYICIRAEVSAPNYLVESAYRTTAYQISYVDAICDTCTWDYEATTYRALLRKMSHKWSGSFSKDDQHFKASYGSSPPCMWHMKTGYMTYVDAIMKDQLWIQLQVGGYVYLHTYKYIYAYMQQNMILTAIRMGWIRWVGAFRL